MMSDKTKGIIQLVVVIAFIALSFTASMLLQSGQKKPQRSGGEDRTLFVQTQIIAPAPYRIAFDATGVVQARAEISITPQVSGNVIAVNDKLFAGGAFDADDILFEIEPLDFELELRRLEASVAQAGTAFNLENAEAEAALAEWRFVNGDAPAPSLVARKPQKAEAWANLKSAKAQLENAKLDLERTRFSLPYSGRVLDSNIEIGQFVSAGQSYGTAFNIESLEVQASLQGRQLEWLSASDDPKISIVLTQQGESRIYEGFLKRNASSLNTQTRFASITIGFVTQPDNVLPGMFAELMIEGQELNEVVKIPASALQKEGIIWLANEDNTITSFTPDIIYSDKDHVAIKGLDKEITVVTTRVSGGSDGMSVEMEETMTNTGAE